MTAQYSSFHFMCLGRALRLITSLGPFYEEIKTVVFKCFFGKRACLDDTVLAVHHSFKCLAEDLNVLMKLSGLDFPKDRPPLCVNLIKVQSTVVLLLGQLVLCEGTNNHPLPEVRVKSPDTAQQTRSPFFFSEGPKLLMANIQEFLFLFWEGLK